MSQSHKLLYLLVDMICLTVSAEPFPRPVTFSIRILTHLLFISIQCNLTEYFSAVDTKCMAGLWAALLHERRVAIVASKPSRLSACVQAANATLFPMSWQHIFIPILPKHLVDYLLAPMPFLIGVPASVMEVGILLIYLSCNKGNAVSMRLLIRCDVIIKILHSIDQSVVICGSFIELYFSNP